MGERACVSHGGVGKAALTWHTSTSTEIAARATACALTSLQEYSSWTMTDNSLSCLSTSRQTKAMRPGQRQMCALSELSGLLTDGPIAAVVTDPVQRSVRCTHRLSSNQL